MEEQFRAVLLASAGVAAVSTRISWDEVPQGSALPYARIWLVSSTADHTLDGPSGPSEARVQVDCFAASSKQAVAFARAVRSALDGYRGGPFQGVFFADARNTRDSGSTDAARIYGRSLDFIVHYNNL